MCHILPSVPRLFLILAAAGLSGTVCADASRDVKPSGKGKEMTFILLKNLGGSGRFVLRNDSEHTVEVLTNYGVYLEHMPFVPGGVKFEYKADGRWTGIPNPVVGYRGIYKLRPHTKVEFSVGFALFKGAELKKGTLVRVGVGGAFCEPFAYHGE